MLAARARARGGRADGRAGGRAGGRARPRSARAAARCAAAAAAAPPVREGVVVVVDNYDSFTYNVCQYLGDLGCDFDVVRNDEITLEELEAAKPRAVLISPGPGAPEDSGISLGVCTQVGKHTPVMGICMGHQCIGQAYGGKVTRAPVGVMHGKTSMVNHEGLGVLRDMPQPFMAARYHSLVVDKETFPEDLEPTAWSDDGMVMALRHRTLPIHGVQFHPESIITPEGKAILKTWLELVDEFHLGR